MFTITCQRAIWFMLLIILNGLHALEKTQPEGAAMHDGGI